MVVRCRKEGHFNKKKKTKKKTSNNNSKTFLGFTQESLEL